jgi:hypothetical protein
MNFDNLVDVDCGLDSPELNPEHRLNAVIQLANKNPLSVQYKTNSSTSEFFWSANHYSLNNVTLFNDSPDTLQNEILKKCSQGLLEETYFIEKAGMTFAAKMILLGENTQEKMLYSHFASDEAAHLQLIKLYLKAQPTVSSHNEFLNLLTEVIETGDKTCLTFVIQIILEGWGLSHYKALSLDCIDGQFKEAINFILKDEAQHYRSGVILFDQKKITKKQQDWIVDILIRFFKMVQMGPQQVVAHMESAFGSFSKKQKLRIFSELKCEAHSAERLKILSNLIKATPFVDDLESKGLFKPWTAEQCSQANEISLVQSSVSAFL